MFDMFPELGIEYYRLNVDLPYSEQKPVDAILHKLSYSFGNPSRIEIKSEFRAKKMIG